MNHKPVSDTIMTWPHHDKVVILGASLVVFLMMMADVSWNTPDLWLVIIFSAVVAGLAGVVLGLILTPAYILLITALAFITEFVRAAIGFIQR